MGNLYLPVNFVVNLKKKNLSNINSLFYYQYLLNRHVNDKAFYKRNLK